MSKPTAPPEWQEPANLLARGNPPHVGEVLARVLRDRRTLAILPEIERALGERAGEGARRDLLWIIGSRGGWQPAETETARAARRRKMARLARELSEAMADDPGCERFTLERLWALAQGIEPSQLHYERRKPETTMPSIAPGDGLKWANCPRVSDALAAFADALDRDASGDALPLTPFDRRPAWQPLAAQPGRKEAPSLLLERALCQWFERHTESHHPEWVAPIVEVALNLPDAVDSDDLSHRWRKFTARA